MFYVHIPVYRGLPRWLSGKESACQCRGCWRHRVQIPGSGRFPLEEEMATYSNILAWKMLRAEEPGRLYSPWDHKSQT